MMPEETKAFAASVLAVVLFASNFLFYAQSGYFDQAAELKPLLHTWSLAVEEQFYILFPLLFLLLWRYGRRVMLAAFVLLFLGSLLLAQTGGNFEPRQSLQEAAWSWQSVPSWGFYLLPSRMWELILGSIIAVSMAFYSCSGVLSRRAAAEIGSLTGLALIAYAVATFDHTTPYPSVYTLVPTVGAGLVILFASPGTIAYKVLSNPVLVGLGLISYSTYLWHHPLFAFARIYSLNEPGQPTFLVLAAMSVVLAYLTWRFVEQPFRNRTLVLRPTMVRASAVAACLLVAFCAASLATGGYAFRFDKAQFLVKDEAGDFRCRRKADASLETACRFGTGEPSVAVIGDSHARALVQVLGHVLGKTGGAVVDLHVAGCAPVRNFLRLGTGDRCRRQDDVFDYLLAADHLKHVVIATRWATKFDVSRFDNEEGGVEFGVPTILYPDINRIGRPITLADAIGEAVRELIANGKTVTLVYPIPEVGWDVPNHMAKLKRREALRGDISTSHAVFKSRNAAALAALDAIADHPNLRRVYPERIFCNTVRAGRCMASLDLKSLYTDTNHLSHLGARMVVAEIVESMPLNAPTRQSGLER